MKINEIAKELGKRGGKTTLKLHGKQHYIDMAKKSNEAQKAKKSEVVDK